MVEINGSLFIQIANFLVLIWVLNTILYRPIRNVLRERSEKVRGLEESISASKTGAKEKEDAFNTGLKESRVKGLKEKDALIQTAATEEKNILAKINEKSAAELAKIREKVAKDAEAVRNSLLRDIDTFANEISRKILGREI